MRDDGSFITALYGKLPAAVTLQLTAVLFQHWCSGQSGSSMLDTPAVRGVLFPRGRAYRGATLEEEKVRRTCGSTFGNNALVDDVFSRHGRT